MWPHVRGNAGLGLACWKRVGDFGVIDVDDAYGLTPLQQLHQVFFAQLFLEQRVDRARQRLQGKGLGRSAANAINLLPIQLAYARLVFYRPDHVRVPFVE